MTRQRSNSYDPYLVLWAMIAAGLLVLLVGTVAAGVLVVVVLVLIAMARWKWGWR